MDEIRYTMKPGDPVLVFIPNIVGADRRLCQMMKDTDRDTNSFIIGRIHGDKAMRFESENSDFSAVLAVITPAGVIASCMAVNSIYTDALQLLGVWEDWELENNGIVYSGFFEQHRVGTNIYWDPVNPFRNSDSFLTQKRLMKNQKPFILPTASSAVLTDLKEHIEGMDRDGQAKLDHAIGRIDD